MDFKACVLPSNSIAFRSLKHRNYKVIHVLLGPYLPAITIWRIKDGELLKTHVNRC